MIIFSSAVVMFELIWGFFFLDDFSSVGEIVFKGYSLGTSINEFLTVWWSF